MLVVPVLAAGVINGFGHWPMPWGRRFFYRNGQTQDWSVNICSWGVVICGEELHNNHHLYPKSAKLSLLPHEFDIGWMYIRIFERLGWVKVKYIHGRTVN
jgi:stearoyl-CoA desaturase (delta-9 desaturase)